MKKAMFKNLLVLVQGERYEEVGDLLVLLND